MSYWIGSLESFELFFDNHSARAYNLSLSCDENFNGSFTFFYHETICFTSRGFAEVVLFKKI